MCLYDYYYYFSHGGYMPKGFSEREKELIKIKLFEKGSELFAKYGLKKTSIDEIVKAVGISKGAFYKFYNTKEELFINIIRQVEKDYRATLDEELSKLSPSELSLEYILNRSMELIEDNPLILTLVKPDEFNYIYRKMPEEAFKENMEIDHNYTESLINKLKEKGVKLSCDNSQLMALSMSVLALLIYKDLIGQENYKYAMSTIIKALSEHLTIK